MSDRDTRARGAAVVALVVGLGLVAAPFAFRMFERAPEGGVMLDEFRPYMNDETIGRFRGWMADIGAAETEIQGVAAAGDHPGVVRWHGAWADIDAEMGDMLDDMDASLDNFAAVDALPPFSLFPWFFVLPGLMAAGLGVVIMRSAPRRALAGLAALGVGLVAAPFVFQMFERAPLGKEMIDTFRPLMTEEKTRRVQGYFLVLGAAEADLRLRVLPELDSGTAGAAESFVEQWPTISNEMAPMIGTMIDNLDNYAAVDAMPAFSLFPWFFVAPGIVLAGTGAAARARHRPVGEASGGSGGPGEASASGAPPQPTRPEPTRSP